MRLSRWGFGVLCAWLALTPVWLTPRDAAAQEDAAKEKAKEIFARGKADYDAGRFVEALAAFQEAYATKPVPMLLKIIAQTHEALENLPAAVDSYAQYQGSNPKDADKIAEKLDALRKVLAASWATVDLTSEPTGAEVWLNKKSGPARGTTPMKLQLPAGTQTLVLEKAGFQTVQRAVKLTAGRTLTLGLALPVAMPTLTVRTTPVGADVLLDGAPIGRTPFSQAVTGGARRLELRLSGHEPHVETLQLTAAHTSAAPLIVEATLRPLAAEGALAVQIDRPGSLVLVNDREVGRSPLTEPLRLPEGLHKLVVRAEGARAHEEMVTVNAGQTTTTRIELGGVVEAGGGGGPSTRTWGWVLVGTGAAALAAGGVFGALAFSADGDLEDCRADPACARTPTEVDRANEVRSKAMLTDISLGAGVVLAGAGLAVVLLSDAPTEARVGVIPLVGGAAASGRWEF